MSVPDENITKCTLLVQKSPLAFINYHTMLFPPHFILQTKHARERHIETQRNSITQHYFMKGKQNVFSLQKVICGLVSLFLLHIMKIAAACKGPSVFNHISSSFS